MRVVTTYNLQSLSRMKMNSAVCSVPNGGKYIVSKIDFLPRKGGCITLLSRTPSCISLLTSRWRRIE